MQIMKICKFCDQTNDDNAKVCSSCAGNEFSYKCSNCGTLFDNGNFCPRCGIKIGTKAKTCPSCGNEYYTNACPNCGFTSLGTNPKAVYANTVAKQSSQKRKIWLWILGWIFIFPLPLTILLIRKKNMKPVLKYGIITVAWILFLVIGFAAAASNTTSENGSGKTSNSNNIIKDLVFTSSTDEALILKIGEKCSSGYLNVKVEDVSKFSSDDVIFVTDNSEVATISPTKVALATCLYFDILAVGPGETQVYATSKDGSVVSERIKVTVTEPILADKITIETNVKELVLGETVLLTAKIDPDNAEDKTTEWSSSDRSIVEVDEKGNAIAVGGGTATITATSKNGKTDSIQLHVDGSKRSVVLKVSRSRQDTNNIGNDWQYVIQVNDESPRDKYNLAVGDKLVFYAQFTEEDINPDVGEASSSYTVTEADLLNGFSVTLDLYVTENAGPNSGQNAYFTVLFEFKP